MQMFITKPMKTDHLKKYSDRSFGLLLYMKDRIIALPNLARTSDVMAVQGAEIQNP